MGFHKYVFIVCFLQSSVSIVLLVIFLWICYIIPAFRKLAGMKDTSVSMGLKVSCGFPMASLRVSCTFSVGFPWDASGFPPGSCGFPVGFLLSSNGSH